ncbi:MAG TPA: AAA family ATPase [Candidatus Limnocylindrales bacterium]|nr:AAA family ATPase [Candidatus Limnocylindrales bacterium]
MTGPVQRPDTARPPVVIALPDPERTEVVTGLDDAGFDTIPLPNGASLTDAFGPRTQSVIAVVDIAGDPAGAIARVRTARRGRPDGALAVVYSATDAELDGLAADLGEDEVILRPWSVEALRWRVEAMAIRAVAPTSENGEQVLSGGHIDVDWAAPGAPIFAVFNPKGGVGKTTIATNLAAVLQIRKHMNVLLLDADTVTGHVALSLGLATPRSAADSWLDEDAGYGHESLLQIGTRHTSGITVAALTTNPLSHPNLVPSRVADAIMEARQQVDAVVVDLHPSYSEVNLAIFAIADRILVPVTPDLPAMRAAIQLKEVAVEIGVRDRLSMIINRANSGVTVGDMEQTVGLNATAHIRSAGLHFVWSANAGKTLIDKFPKHPVAQDFEHLSDRLMSLHKGTPAPERSRESGNLLKALFSRKAISEA